VPSTTRPASGTVLRDMDSRELPATHTRARSMILRMLWGWRERRSNGKASPLLSGRDVAALGTLPTVAFDVLDVNRASCPGSGRALPTILTERQYLIDAAKWS